MKRKEEWLLSNKQQIEETKRKTRIPKLHIKTKSLTETLRQHGNEYALS